MIQQNKPSHFGAAVSFQPNTKAIGQHVYFQDTTVSTNLDAKNTPNAPHGSLFLAECQTGGRGRMGRSWSAPHGSGIWASILLKPTLSPDAIPLLTLICGLSITKVLRNQDLDARIKWPNDILLRGKKICGILSELACTTEGKHVILGFGINVNTEKFPKELSEKATSLFLESGKKWERKTLLAEILAQLEADYLNFSEFGFSPFLHDYESLCATIGQSVRILLPDREFSAKAIGISADGALLAEENGIIQTIRSGEVSVRGLLGYHDD